MMCKMHKSKKPMQSNSLLKLNKTEPERFSGRKDNTMYKEITQGQALEIIQTRQPLGLFFHQSEKGYVGIDNSDGEAWTEDFSTREECMQWLRNCD